MRALEQVMLAGQALRHTAPQLARPRLWAWVLPLAAAELGVVALLWNAAHPAVSWFMAPLLERAGGEAALHYPWVFERMPELFRRADAVLVAVLGPIGIGAATPAFAARFRGRPVHALASLAEGFRRAPDLVLALLPFNLLLLALPALVGALLGGRGGLVGRAAPLGLAALSLVVQAAFFYVAARVMLEGRPAWAALRTLASSWREGFLPALLVSAAVLVLLLPLQAPGVTAALLVERGRPELAGALTILRAASGWLNGFLLTGAATLLYLSAVAPREERP